ncbi:MAG: hypothetical protein Q9227_004590 [Pyrenula ochraceoflavens]
MQLTKPLNLTAILSLATITLAIPQSSHIARRNPPHRGQCDCPGWSDGSPTNPVKCYMVDWLPDVPSAWGGGAGTTYCALFNGDGNPDPNLAYQCRMDGTAGNFHVNCNVCAQSGSPGSEVNCAGVPICYMDEFGEKIPNRCQGDQSMCPQIQGFPGAGGKPWWECGQKPPK